VDRLTATERAMAELLAEGAENTEIARRLGVSTITVKNTLSNVYRVLRLPADRNRRVTLARLVLGHRDTREE
jgi:DNA-binding NarL/FixJ family response regulator